MKKILMKRITIATITLLVFIMFCIFPKKEEENPVEEIKSKYKTILYTLDNNNYVSKIVLDINDALKDKLECLIENSVCNINKDFKKIIPEYTKILNITIDGAKVNINFSKELLNISPSLEEKMIEAIIYTITEKDYENVEIYVEGNLLEKLPNSKEILTYPLNRSYGINKYYNVNSLNNLSSTTIYFSKENYYVPITFISNNNDEKISIIIDELKSSVLNQSNLSSYLNVGAELKEYEIVEDTMYLTFNELLFDSVKDKKLLEEVKYTISYSVKDNYDINEVIFKVEDEEIDKMVMKSLE